MATQEKIVLDLEITGLESIDELNKQLSEARANYKGAQAGSTQYNEAAKKINEVNGKLAEHKNALKQVENQSKLNENTIEGLRAKYKDLSAQAIRTDIGSQKFKDLQVEAKAVNDRLKDLEKGMGDTRRNVGNYAEGFKEAIGGLGGSFGNAIKGVQGFNTALAANPIGAVVQVLNLLFNALGKNDNLMVAFQGTMKGIGVVVDNVSNFIANIVEKFADFTNSGTKASTFVNDFGKRLLNAVLAPFQLIKDFIPVISNLMDGNFSAAFKNGATAMGNFGKNILLTNTDTNALIKSIGGLVGSGTALSKGLDDLEEKQSYLNVTLAKNEVIVQRLRIQAKKRGEDTAEGLKLLTQAEKVEEENLKKRTALIDEEIRIYENYRKTLGKGSKEEEDIRFKLNDLRTKRTEAEGQAYVILDKIANQEATLREKQAAATEKSTEKLIKLRDAQFEYEKYVYNEGSKLVLLQIDEEIKRAETLEDIQKAKIKKAEKARDREIESLYATNEEKAAAEQKYTNDLLDINKEYNDKKAKQNEDAAKKKEKDNKEDLDRKERNAKNTLAILQNVGAISAQFGEEAKGIQKAAGITSAIISTYQGAAAALAPPPVGAGPVLGPILAATTIGLGLVNVASIAAAAGGGDFVTTKPTLLLVGDNPGGRERVTVEPLSGRGQTKINNSGLIAMAGGGSLTVNSSAMQSVSSTASKGVMEQMALSNTISSALASIGTPVVSVVDIKKVTNKTNVTEAKARLRAKA